MFELQEAAPLGQYIDVKHGFAFEGQHFCDQPTRHVLITPGNFAIGGGFQKGKAKYYSGPIPPEYILNEGDLIVTMTDLSKAGDTLGYPALIPAISDRVYLHNQRIGLVSVTEPNLLDVEYLYYLLRTPGYRHHVLATASGSTVRHTSPTRIRDFVVQLPQIDEQRNAVAVLRSVDDKIDQNRRTARALEELARATFKAWFVDFEPVKAKADGAASFPGMPYTTFAALPDHFCDSEIGPVPQGWEMGKVGDLGDVICGKTPPTGDPLNYGNDVDFITIPDMHEKVFVSQTARKLSSKGANSQRNKFVPARSIAVSCIATPGLVVMTSGSAQTNQQINTVIPRDGFDPYFCYELLLCLGDHIKAGGSGGSVFHNLNKSSFEAINVPIPPRGLISAYGSIVKPLFDAMLESDAESSKLVDLRDYLLPRLLSGQVRVRPAQTEVKI